MPKSRNLSRLPNGEAWNQAAWKLARKRAMAMYEPICAICHKPIDMNAPAFTPESCEVDHIIPVSRGGAPYEVSNLQLTHTRCNRAKGARMDSDYTELKSSNSCPLSNNW